ncbi:MAG: sugar fermentation stimulation protein [Eubacteriaceae bacterium]|nr:sugar fermentation stimulation protein [Eubacteriaceae bacterium]
MKLSNQPLVQGFFNKRLNRFLAEVVINGQKHGVHVPNTGRMRELLLTDAKVLISFNPAPERKTDYTLRAVMSDGVWVSVDSGLANKIAAQYLDNCSDISGLQSEVTYKKSRFDFYACKNGKDTFYEIKSVNLLVDGIAKFPDAPTKRGAKHLLELMDAYRNGFGAGILFIVMRADAKAFSPNWEIDSEFSRLLGQCHSLGLEIRALSCDIDGINIKILEELPVQWV